MNDDEENEDEESDQKKPLTLKVQSKMGCDRIKEVKVVLMKDLIDYFIELREPTPETPESDITLFGIFIVTYFLGRLMRVPIVDGAHQSSRY